jgi:hypothetical protein
MTVTVANHNTTIRMNTHIHIHIHIHTHIHTHIHISKINHPIGILDRAKKLRYRRRTRIYFRMQYKFKVYILYFV